jgi:hypothetical protein
MNAEEAVLNKQMHGDDARISNLSLIDQIRFSTVNLSIYQRQAIRRELIPNYKNIDAYEPSFGSKIHSAFRSGWKVFESIVLFLFQIWGLFFFGLVIYGIYKSYRQWWKK